MHKFNWSLVLIVILQIVKRTITVAPSSSQQYCYNNQYLNSQTYQCQNCDQKCERCIEQSCISCSIGEKNDGTCLNEFETCNKGQFLNKKEKKCQNCSVSFCKSCSEYNQCEYCFEGFTLQKGSQCIKDETNQDADKYYQYACSSLQQENSGDCSSQEICSSFTFKSETSFEQNVKMIIEYEQSNFIIGISNTQAIIFKSESMTYFKEIINLQQSQKENFIYQALYKKVVLILSSQSLYAFNLETFKLEAQIQYQSQENANDSDQRQIISDEKNKEIIYFALTDNSQNIRQIRFGVVYDDESNAITLSIQKDQNYLLFANENDFIQNFFFYKEYSLISIISLTKVSFLDLNSTNLKTLTFSVPNQQFQNNLVLIKKSEQSEQSQVLTFYAIKQTQQLQYILKIEWDRNNKNIISSQSSSYDWTYFNDQTYLRGYIYFNWFTYEIGSKIFILLIAHQENNYLIAEQQKFIGIADIEFFFSGSSYYSFEIYSLLNWFRGQTPLLSSKDMNNNNNDDFILFIPFQNEINIYEVKRDTTHQLIPVSQSISFEKINDYVILKKSKSASSYIFILDKIIGRFQLFGDQPNITLKMSSKMIYNSKNDLYFEKENNLVYTPIEIENKESKYSFVIIYSINSARISIIQIEGKTNGEQVMIAQNFISHTSNNGDEKMTNNDINSTLMYEEFQLLYIITNKGVFQISYFTLDVKRFIPLKNTFMSHLNVVLIKDIFDDELNGIPQQIFVLTALTVSPNPDDNPDTIVRMFEAQNSYFLTRDKTDFRVNSRKREVYFLLVQFETAISFVISYFGYQGEIIVNLQNQLVKIKSKSFLSDDSMGIVIEEMNGIQSFLKIKFLIDQNKLIFEQHNFVIPQEFFDCMVYEFSEIATCNKITPYDEYKYLTMFLFKWEIMSFVVDANGEEIGKKLTKVEDFESMLINQSYMIKEDSLYNIYIILRLYSKNQLNQISNEAEIISSHITFNIVTGEYRFISQSEYFIVPISSLIIKQGDLSYYSSSKNYSSRFISPHKFLHYLSYINTGVSFIIQSYAYRRDQSSLLFIQQNQIINAKRFGEFQPKKSLQMQFLFSVNELGLVALKANENQIQFVSIDNLQLIYTVDLEEYAKIFYSKKFSSLIIIVERIISVYFQQNQFQQPTHTIDLSLYTTNLYPDCILLDETPFIACQKIGLFNYEKKKAYIHKSLLIFSQRRLAQKVDNIYYAIFNGSTNLFIFSHQEEQFLENQKISTLPLVQITLHLHPSISDQIIAFEQQTNDCSIYSLPNFYKIFSFSSKSVDESNSGDKCFYDPIFPSLIIKSQKMITIHQLPYNISKKPTELSAYNSFNDGKYITTNQYLYNIYDEKYLDYSTVVRLDSFNLETGQTNSRKMVLTEQIQEVLNVWEEKEIIYTSDFIISIGDIDFGWSTSDKIIDYSDRFNYMLAENVLFEMQFLALDVSEMFPFNQYQSQFINSLEIQNQNIYTALKEGQIDTILYFNNEIFTLTKSSFNSDTSQIILDLQNINDVNFNLNNYKSSYKTPYKIFYVKNKDAINPNINENPNADINMYGFQWKCQLLIFQENKFIKMIDLKNFKCQVSVFGSEVYIINQDKLEQLYYKDGKLQMITKQLNSNNIIEGIKIDQKFKWMLVSFLNSNCVIYRNSESEVVLQQQTIQIPSLQISSVNFINLKDITVLIIGQKDSTVTMFSLLSQDSQSADIQISNSHSFNYNSKLIIYFSKIQFLIIIL